MKNRRPILIKICFVFIEALVALALIPSIQAQSKLYLDIKSSKPETAQVYYDDGTGFSEANSAKAKLKGNGDFERIEFAIPAGNLKAIRFDPLEKSGSVELRSVNLKSGDKQSSIPLDQIMPINQIAKTEIREGVLFVETTPGALDSQLALPITRDLPISEKCIELNEDVQNQSTIYVEIKCSKPETAQIYYDDGSGFSEAHSARAKLKGNGDFEQIEFVIPVGNLKALRLDPLEESGSIELRSVDLKSGDKRSQIPLGQITPANQIAKTKIGEGMLYVETLPGASDPQLSLPVPHDFTVKQNKIWNLWHVILILFSICIIFIIIYTNSICIFGFLSLKRFKFFVNYCLAFLSLLFVLVSVLCLLNPFDFKFPGEGLDPSWAFALSQAIAQGLTFGRDIIFTFGPYGFIYTKLFHPEIHNLRVWSSLYLYITYSLIFYSVFRNTKKHLIIMLLSFSSGLFILSLDSLFCFYPILLVAYVLTGYTKSCSSHIEVWKWFALIFLLIPLGLFPLIKGSFIVSSIFGSVLVILYFGFSKKLPQAIASAIIPLFSLIFFWSVSGQNLLYLPVYFISIIPIISGYTGAMASSGFHHEIVIYVLCSLIIILTIFITNNFPIKIKLLLVFGVAVNLFVSFKAAFVRHDDGHAQIACSTILLIGIFLHSFLRSGQARNFMLFTVFYTLLIISGSYRSVDSKNIIPNIKNTYENGINKAKEYVKISKLDYLSKYNESLVRIYNKNQIPILDGSCDIYSYGQAFLLASKNNWNPRPVFQSYSAYTPSLIHKNETHLLGENSPENILYKVETIDNRLPCMDDGASLPIILTNYSPVGINNGYIFLKKDSHENKVQKSIILEKKIMADENIRIPVSMDHVFLQINVKPTILGKLTNILYKTPQLSINLILHDGSTRKFRIVSGMVRTDVLVSNLIENTEDLLLLYSANKYREYKKVESFSISSEGYPYLWEDEMEIQFSSVPFGKDINLSEILDIKKPSLIDFQQSISSTDSFSGFIDFVNGLSPSTSKKIYIESFLRLDGWFALSTDKGKLPDNVKIALTTEDGTRYLFDSKRTTRPDVAAYFKSPNLEACGYSAYIDVSELLGNVTLELAYLENGIVYLCPRTKLTLEVGKNTSFSNGR
jgi:hypothetical protein